MESRFKGSSELRDLAIAFITAFRDAPVEPKTSDRTGISFGASGIVVLDEELTRSLASFVEKASELIGPLGSNQPSIQMNALREAHNAKLGDADVKASALRLIEKIFKQGNFECQFVAPNHLLRFVQDKEIRIGPVQALTRDSVIELAKEFHSSYRIHSGDDYTLDFRNGRFKITMPANCWLIELQGDRANLAEEAKWLMDIAVSLLRLLHQPWAGHHPGLGDIEPHPVTMTSLHKPWFTVGKSSGFFGGSVLPPWYEIDSGVVSTVNDPKFISIADSVFFSSEKTTGWRVKHGLGWLTRARQSGDRAERLLFYFTAIEALLSSKDQFAPVSETIARNGAVLLTDDIGQRMKFTDEIKRLYNLRSGTIHRGERSLWHQVNRVEEFAEAMFRAVLNEFDMCIDHGSFCKELSECSFGSTWPKQPIPHS